jgi:hypothetical protein
LSHLSAVVRPFLSVRDHKIENDSPALRIVRRGVLRAQTGHSGISAQ